MMEATEAKVKRGQIFPVYTNGYNISVHGFFFLFF